MRSMRSIISILLSVVTEYALIPEPDVELQQGASISERILLIT